MPVTGHTESASRCDTREPAHLCQCKSDAFHAALLRIATMGDALSAQECQEIAAEALGISVPEPPPKVGFRVPASQPAGVLPSHIKDKIDGVYYGSAKALE